MSSEKSSKSMEAFAWGDNSGGCLGLPPDTSAGLLPRTLEPYGLLPGERVVAVSCSERYVALSRFCSLCPVYCFGSGALFLQLRCNDIVLIFSLFFFYSC